MRLTATVMGERTVSSGYYSTYQQPKTETYTAGDVSAEGDAALIGASLRALADAIDPPRAENTIDDGARRTR